MSNKNNLSKLVEDFDAQLQQVVEEQPVEDVVKSDEVTEETTEEVEKSKEAKEDEKEDTTKKTKKSDEDDEADEKEEAKKSTEEPVEDVAKSKKDVAKSKKDEDKKADKEEEAEKSDDETDEADKKEEAKQEKKAEKAQKSVEEPEEEEVLKANDILGAFEAVFKGLATLTSNQAQITNQLTTLVSTMEATNTKVDTEIAKSITPAVEETEEVVKAVEDVEGKAVGFVQKSIGDVTDAEVNTEVVEEKELEPTVELDSPVSVAQQALTIRDEFLNTYKDASTKQTVTRGQLDQMRTTWNNVTSFNGTAHDLGVIEQFIADNK